MKVQRVLIGVAVVVVMAACGASESTQPSASPETVAPTTTTIYEVNHGVAVNPELVRAAGSVVNSLPSATVDSICDAYANALAAGATQDQLYGTFLQVLGEYFTGTGVPNREIFDELNRRC